MQLQRRSPEQKKMQSRLMVMIITLLILTFAVDFHAVPASYSLSPQESPYKLPYPAGKTYKVTQGNSGDYSHYGKAKYAFDFDSKFDGGEVVAARDGKVLYVKDDSNEGGCDKKYSNKANYVVIDHGDGTSALYLHLQYESVTCKEGQEVEQGQIIARADSTGYTCGAHLHFQVQKTPKSRTNWYTQSIQISFSDADVLAQEKDGVPKQGKSYVSDNAPANDFLDVKGKIVFQTTYPISYQMPQELWAVNADGTGKVSLPTRFYPNTLSPDGENLACIEKINEIIIATLEGKELRRIQLTDIPRGRSCGSGLKWSPNGQKFSFDCGFKSKDINPIYVINSDGSGLVQIADGLFPAWSPDSKKIVFTNQKLQLCIVNADGTNLKDLGIRGSAPDWCPDGKKIAYVADTEDLLGDDLYIFNLENSQIKRLTFEPQGVDIWNPIWSPDATKIVFGKYTYLESGVNSTIYVIDSDGSNLIQLALSDKEYSEIEIYYSLIAWVPEKSLPLTEEMPIAWGKMVSSEFKTKVIGISNRLGVAVNYLMAAMAFETGRTFDPSITNPNSGATGLIQFMPSTARNLGTTTDALRVMSAVEQLDYVEKYFQPYRGRLTTLEDVYMAILWPKAIGKPNDYVLFAEPSIYYTQNRGLDINSDGQVTKAEASSKVKDSLIEGLTSSNQG